MPLFLAEVDVLELLDPADALPVIEGSFARLATGAALNLPRARMALENGYFAVMAATDTELGYAGLKSYTVVGGRLSFVVCLFRLDDGSLDAVIEADALGQLRTGAASGVAAKYLARPEPLTLGVIGCGWQAESQLAAIRAAQPTIDRVVAYCRTAEALAEFCERVGAEPAGSHSEAADADIVVTATTSKEPVLRGEWLRDGALVCAIGANDARHRELDNVVLQRASFVCCDSREQAKLESGDLIEPVAAGILDWLEVHELQDVVAGTLAGRDDPTDIVVFKSNGLAAWDVAIGVEAVRRARESGAGSEL